MTGMKRVDCALVYGDGSAPEMMEVACACVGKAAEKNGYQVVFHSTPMGWVAYKQYDDTLPEKSLERATEIGLLFFGGVGDPQMDSTIGEQFPDQRPEARCLMTLRKKWQLLHNFRPMIFYPELRECSNLAPRNLPENWVLEWHFVRFLLQDSYFGTRDLYEKFSPELRRAIGLYRKGELPDDAKICTDLAYFTEEMLERYFRVVFSYARKVRLPVIAVDKQNIMTRFDFWRKIYKRVRDEFPDVEVKEPLYVDAANATLIQNPQAMHGVIACANEHGDFLSDGGAAALGSMGVMCSSAVNLETGAAMFESGAGTAPTLAKKNKANPLGRILTGAMLLDHVGAIEAAQRIRQAVRDVISAGYRTADIARKDTPPGMILGTREMGQEVLDRL